MHDETGGLVKNDQGVILMHDIERDVLRCGRLGTFVRRLGEADLLTAPQLELRLANRYSTDRNPPFSDPALQTAARVLGP